MCYHWTEKSGCLSEGITLAQAVPVSEGEGPGITSIWYGKERTLSLLWGLAHQLRRPRTKPFMFLQKHGQRDGKIIWGNHWSEERTGKETSSCSQVSRRAPVNEAWPSRVAEWQEGRATEAPSPLRNSPTQSVCRNLSKTRLGIKFL